MYLATLARRGGLDSTDSMTQHRIESATDEPTVPPILLSWLAVFRPCFSAPVWNHVLVLVGGAVLAPGKRTVTQALRVTGLADKPGFGRYHEVLNRARWDARDVARRLLLHLLAVLSALQVAVASATIPVRTRLHLWSLSSTTPSDDREEVSRISFSGLQGLEPGDVCPDGSVNESCSMLLPKIRLRLVKLTMPAWRRE